MPFIGAGFSKNAILPAERRMPDWAELTAELAKDALTSPGTEPPIVAQRYEKLFGRVQLIEAIRDALQAGWARPGKAHTSFARLPFDTVYTTNFDMLIEDAYTEQKRPFRSLVGELQLPFHAGQIASSIVKLHGDLRHEEHIIITERDYAEFMRRYPAIATHLSAMLITRTPLFVGYSLSDPDFNSIRAVIRSRLGDFERMSYVIQFNVPVEQVERALEDKLHILSVPVPKGGSYDNALAELFDEIQRQLDMLAGSALRKSRPDLFERVDTAVTAASVASQEDKSVLEATSRLCFVLMPFAKEFDDIYQMLIKPIARDMGMDVMRADEMTGTGFVIEEIRSAIQQARVCVADVTGSNANVLYEVGYAQALQKPLVMLADKNIQNFPFDVAHNRIFLYDHSDLDSSRRHLRAALLALLSEDKLAEADRLFQRNEYRGAIAAATVVLEQHLRDALEDKVARADRMALGQLVTEYRRHNTLAPLDASDLSRVIAIRAAALHTVVPPSREDAEFVLRIAVRILEPRAEDATQPANA